MATQNSWGNQIAAANSAITLNSGTNAVNISTDAAATTLSIGTGGAVKGLTLGSTNSTSASTLQSGSGALAVTSTGGTLTINSGTGALGISTDASATTCNFATGGAAKVVTLGSTSGASSLALKTGTADFSLASATGNIMVAQDTGEINYPLQSAFYAYNSAQVLNVTGDGTNYVMKFDSTLFDQNSDFNTSTYTFTAPITGKYKFDWNAAASNIGVAHTVGYAPMITTARTYKSNYQNFALAAAANGVYIMTSSMCVPMTAGDTAFLWLSIFSGTKTVTYEGVAGNTFFSGYLVC